MLLDQLSIAPDQLKEELKIFGGDFNVFLDVKEKIGGSIPLKRVGIVQWLYCLKKLYDLAFY